MSKESDNKSTLECVGCGKNHRLWDCPHKEDIKALVIARIEQMPDNMRVYIA